MINHHPPAAASAICLIVVTHTLSVLSSDLGLLTAQRASKDDLFQQFVQT